MTELPNELRSLLDMARDAHEPTDPQAQVRVRNAIAASLLVAGGAASTSLLPQAASNTQMLGGALKAKTGWALLGSKLTTWALGAVTVAGLGVAAYQYRALPAAPGSVPVALQASAPVVSAPEVEAAQQVAEAATVEAPVVEAMAPSPELAAPEPMEHHARKAQHAPNLAAETALLRTASDALAHGDGNAALAALREHARDFPRGSLREERDGLRAIAECTRTDAPSQASAKRFLQKYPSSLLAARINKACAER